MIISCANPSSRVTVMAQQGRIDGKEKEMVLHTLHGTVSPGDDKKKRK